MPPDASSRPIRPSPPRPESFYVRASDKFRRRPCPVRYHERKDEMGLIAISGQPGCRFEEVARITAGRLGFELVTATRILGLMEQEFAALQPVPEKAYLDLAASIVARLATGHHLVLSGGELELLAKQFRGML